MKKIIWFSLLLTLPRFADSQIPISRNNFIVIAHRGDHTQAPENTLQAFDLAIAHGADYVEVDIRTTRDGKLVVMHDATVDRMTDGTGKVSELDFASLQKLKVYDKLHPEYGAFTIPTFEEVLALCKNRINIYLDFKSADVAATWDLIQKTKTENSFVVYINSEEQYKAWRRVAPKVPLMVSLPDSVTNSTTLARFLDRVDAEILDGNYVKYTAEMVKVAQDRGRAIWADIQQPYENPELWDKALQTKLHGLQTDHPEKLILYLQQKKIR